jgi:hypothetical protein
MAGLVGGGLFATRGSRLQLEGSIRKTRTAALSPTRSLLVLDFRATNTSDYPYVVKTVEVEVTFADGRKEIGQFVPEIDAKTLFPALPVLGDKLADSIGTGENIPKKQTVDRMVAATFPIPESDLVSRKSVLLRIRHVQGPSSELR